jgi:hypothetical protein
VRRGGKVKRDARLSLKRRELQWLSRQPAPEFRPGRHAFSAANYRTVIRGRWQKWDAISETTALTPQPEVSIEPSIVIA